MAGGTNTRVRLDPEARRAQLVDLGVQMLADRTLDQLPVDEIAAAAGISRGLLFHYFPTKRDFGVAVARAAAQRLIDETSPDPSLDLLEQLRAGIDAYVRYVERNRTAYIALVRGAAGGDHALAEVHEETRAVQAERIIAALELSDDSPPAVGIAVRGWIAFVEEATVEWVRDQNPVHDAFVLFLEQALVRLVELAAAA